MNRAQDTFSTKLLIGLLPYGDFVQIGFMAVLAEPLMGSLGAGPREFSSIAVAYAASAVAAIALQRSAIDRMGWRAFLLASAALTAIGVLICAASHTLGVFALGRVLMAVGSAPSLAASRVLVFDMLAGPQRFQGIRFLASGLSWGVSAGPLLAALTLHTSWRFGFAGLLISPAVIAILTVYAVKAPVSHMRPVGLADAVMVGLLAVGSIPVLWALQQANFDFFERPGWLAAGTALSASVLALPLVLEWRRGEGAALALRALSRDSRLITGLSGFALAYLIIGGANLTFPLLLQRGFGVPLDVACGWLGVGSLGGVVSWILLYRLLPRHGGPLRYYMTGLVALLLAGVTLSRLSESSLPTTVLPALVLHGAFVITVLSVTAMQAFQNVQLDRKLLLNANQLKNMMAQIALAAGTAGASLFVQQRSSMHYVRLIEAASGRANGLPDAAASIANALATGGDVGGSLQMARAILAQIVAAEAVFMAALDYFQVVTVVAALSIVIIICLPLVRRLRRQHVSVVAPLPQHRQELREHS